ncbi:MAG: hypothetical protein INF93_16820, partial [Rhodobacter sp.]|nr:hypothetical protein [Rhodobacter sp.]
MDHFKIEGVLENLPAEALSQHRFVRHYFYGPDVRLRRLRTHLKRLRDDVMFEFLDKGLAVTVPVRLDHEGLMQSAEIMESSADDTGLEYDGFEIVLDDVEDQVTLERLEDHVAPGSYLRFALAEGRFGYLLFLGGNKTDGYFFECFTKAYPFEPGLPRCGIRGLRRAECFCNVPSCLHAGHQIAPCRARSSRR